MANSREKFYYNKCVLALQCLSYILTFGSVIALFIAVAAHLYLSQIRSPEVMIPVLMALLLLGIGYVKCLPYFKKIIQQKPALCIDDTGIEYNGKMFLWNKICNVSFDCYQPFRWEDHTPALNFFINNQEYSIYLCLKYTDYQKIFDILRKYCEIHTIKYSNLFIYNNGLIDEWYIKYCTIVAPIFRIVYIVLLLFFIIFTLL